MQILGRLDLGPLSVDEGTISTTRLTDDPSQITRALAEHGIYVRELHSERATLEAAFLKIVAEADHER